MRMTRLLIIVLASLSLLACSDYQRARSAYEGGNYPKAFELFKKMSEAGDLRAEYDLSLLYLQGIGTKQDLNHACYCIRKSAYHGNHLAMVELGRRHEYGIYRDKD